MDNASTLLGLLDAGVGYGYDLKNTYDRWFGARKPLAFGQVYAVLARFSRDGLIASIGGMRIAQMVVAPVSRLHWQAVDQLPASNRETGGFGSTGLG